MKKVLLVVSSFLFLFMALDRSTAFCTQIGVIEGSFEDDPSILDMFWVGGEYVAEATLTDYLNNSTTIYADGEWMAKIDNVLSTLEPVFISDGDTIEFDYAWMSANNSNFYAQLQLYDIDNNNMHMDIGIASYFTEKGGTYQGWKHFSTTFNGLSSDIKPYYLSFELPSGTGVLYIDNINATPEPTTMLLLGVGLLGLAGLSRKKLQ